MTGGEPEGLTTYRVAELSVRHPKTWFAGSVVQRPVGHKRRLFLQPPKAKAERARSADSVVDIMVALGRMETRKTRQV